MYFVLLFVHIINICALIWGMDLTMGKGKGSIPFRQRYIWWAGCVRPEKCVPTVGVMVLQACSCLMTVSLRNANALDLGWHINGEKRIHVRHFQGGRKARKVSHKCMLQKEASSPLTSHTFLCVHFTWEGCPSLDGKRNPYSIGYRVGHHPGKKTHSVLDES